MGRGLAPQDSPFVRRRVRKWSRLPSLAVNERLRGRLAVRRTTSTWSGCEMNTSRV